MVEKSEKQIPESSKLMDELNNIFEESATPRKEFVANLKRQVISQIHNSKPKSNLITILFMKFSQPMLRVGAVVTLLAIGTGVATYAYWFTPKQFANQDDILAKIAQANLGKKKNANEAAPLASATKAQDAKMSALYIRKPEDRNYNYKKITNMYEIGSAAARCAQMIPYQGAVTQDEFTEYFSTKEESYPRYTKNVVYSGTNIYDFNLNIDNEQWQYRGGEYAVHLKNVQRMISLMMEGVPSGIKEGSPATTTDNNVENQKVPVESTTVVNSFPAPEAPNSTTVPENPKDMIKNYFGEDAKILDQVSRDGNEYYKIQWSYKSACGDLSTSPNRTTSSSSTEMDQKMVVVAYADVKDMSIDMQSLYLDSVANRNLLYTQDTSEVSKNTSFAEIKDEFAYTYAKPVKTVDVSAYQYEKEYRTAALDYIKKNMTEVVYLTGKYTLQSLYSSYVTVVPDHERHFIDSAYYSPKAYGVALYNDAKDMFKPYHEAGKSYPKVQLSYAGTGVLSWVSVSEVSSAFVGRAALATLGIETQNIVEKGKMTVKVSGVDVSANVFEQVQTIVPETGSTGSSGSGSVDGGVANDPAMQVPQQVMLREPEYKDIYIVFTNGETTTIVQTSVKSKVTNLEISKALVFEVVKTGDPILLDKALKVAVQIVNGPSGKPELMLR